MQHVACEATLVTFVYDVLPISFVEEAEINIFERSISTLMMINLEDFYWIIQDRKNIMFTPKCRV